VLATKVDPPNKNWQKRPAAKKKKNKKKTSLINLDEIETAS
jgi:hypothetical protein